jgi:hypothetical protein
MRPRAYGNTGLWPSPSHGWMETDGRMSAQSRAHVVGRASALHTGPAVSALPTENGGNQDSEPVEVSLCRPHAEALHELAPELRAAMPAQARATQPHIAVGAADPKLERVVRWVEDSTHAVGAPRRGSAQVSTANGYGGCCTGTSGELPVLWCTKGTSAACSTGAGTVGKRRDEPGASLSVVVGSARCTCRRVEWYSYR